MRLTFDTSRRQAAPNAKPSYVEVNPGVRRRGGSTRFQTGLAVTSPGGSTSNGNGPTPGANPHGGKRQAWQTEAWGYYDGLGEAHNAASLMGAAFARVRLVVGLLGEDGEVGPLRDEDGKLIPGAPPEQLCQLAEDHVSCLKDPVSGQAGLMDSAGRNLMIAGECILVGFETTELNAQTGIEEVTQRTWEVLSADEIKRKHDARRPLPGQPPTTPQWERVWADGRPNTDLPPNTYVQRIWKKHPHYSALSDSSFQAVLDIMEEIVLLTRQVRAVAVSRLAGAGLLMIPSEIDFGEDPSAPEGTREHDPFTVTLIETMSEAIEDRGSPASVVPMVIRADSVMIDRIRHIDLPPADESLEIAKREDAIQRFAQGIDWPVELTVGHQATTFANATQVSEDAFRMHIEPYLTIFAGHLTAGYLWPSLMGSDRQDQPIDEQMARLVVHYDPVALITQPDRSRNALEAWDRLTISNAKLRSELGFGDGDQPDEQEILERIRWQILRATREQIRAMEDTTVSLLPPELIESRGIQTGAPLPPGTPPPGGAPSGGGGDGQASRTSQAVLAKLVKVEVAKAMEEFARQGRNGSG